MFFSSNKTYLFLGCHLDDIEFGCGGLVNQLAQNGNKVYLYTLSVANKNSYGKIQLKRQLNEAREASNYLQVHRDNLFFGNQYGQIFDQNHQALREELIQCRTKFHPDVVFYPAIKDIHQDHGTLASNAFRIFRGVSCFGYEVVRSSFDFHPNVYAEISKENLNAKIKAILSYQSQFLESAGYYFDERIIEGMGRFRGGQCGVQLAEAFECYINIERLFHG